MLLPPLEDLLATLRVVSLPLNTRFRGVDHREVALIEGPSGWGEFGPFLEYADSEASRWLASAVDSAWRDWPAPIRQEVPVNATVPAVPADEVAGIIARYQGCRTVKVKVAEHGQRLQDDLDRVAAARDAIGADGKVRIDANGGWSIDDAGRAIGALSTYGLEYAEQPCATVEELATLRKRLARNGIDVPIAADESIRKAEDPFRVAALAAADVAVIKVAPLGGVHAALDIAERIDLPVVVSSALDSSIGMSAGVALAAAMPQLPFACGLGTIELFEADITSDSVVPQAGTLTPRRVTPGLADEHRAAPDRQAWWRERVERAYAVLAESSRNAAHTFS